MKTIIFVVTNIINMKTQALHFNNIIEALYGLPIEDRLEIKNLLEHNIADTRRNEIFNNYRKALEEHKSGKLKFSSRITELKKML
jgi:hypothetical protein